MVLENLKQTIAQAEFSKMYSKWRVAILNVYMKADKNCVLTK